MSADNLASIAGAARSGCVFPAWQEPPIKPEQAAPETERNASDEPRDVTAISVAQSEE
jgi:hypothetical protein